MEPPVWAWIALILGVPVFAAIDLLVFGRGQQRGPDQDRRPLEPASGSRSGWRFAARPRSAPRARQAAGEYLSGYLIEWSLSIDNLFVFAVIFAYFAVPKEVQPRVLLFGVLGALVFRGIFIAIGAVALGAAHWVIYIFGAFLVFTAYRLARSGDRGGRSRARTGSCCWCGAIVPQHRALSRQPGVRAREGPAPGDAGLRRAARGREHRRGLRHRLDPGHLRHHRRGLHRAGRQRLRPDGPARGLLRGRRGAGALRVPALRPGRRARRRGAEDAHQRDLRPADLDDPRRRWC